jgi:hypothetical protein
MQDVLDATRADAVAAAQVDLPEVLRGHANERETHNFVSNALRKPAQIELMRGLEGFARQVFETTARRETSAKGRSAARNAKSGSKISPNILQQVTVRRECQVISEEARWEGMKDAGGRETKK